MAGGRPTKLTEDVTSQLCEIFRMGNVSISDACAVVGIAESTYYKGMREIPEFSQPIKRARAHAVNDYLTVIRDAAQSGTWQAAAWWLERVRPEQYGRRQTVEVLTQDVVDAEINRLRQEMERDGQP